MAKNILSISLAICLAIGIAARGLAAPSSETLLPPTTKGFISTPNVDQLIAQFNKTQLGELVNDPIMQPFIEDLKRQLSSKFSQAGVRVGITWSDLEGVASGEVALAAIQPEGNKEAHALALVADVAGKVEAARELLAKIDRNQVEKGAKKSTVQAGALQLTVYTLPEKQGEVRAPQKLYGLHNEVLFAADHAGVAMDLALRLAGGAQGDSLADVEAFGESMQYCQQASAGVEPNVRWFVEPFGFAEVTRAASGGRKKRGADLLKVLANQGFTAVQGLGGYVTFATEDHEILHRTLVYAPPVKRAPGEGNGERYDLAARMLDFPNGQNLTPQSWVPRNLATYLTFNWKMQQAFEHSKTLVDEFADDEVFEEVLRSIELDPNGPQINVRKELIQYLSERATVLADYRLPITPKSERVMLAIELTDPKAVERTVAKAMEKDPTAEKREFDGHVIWEIVNEDDAEPIKQVSITGDFGAGGQLGFGDSTRQQEKEEKRSLPNSAISVAHGHLLFATHVDFIRDLLQQSAEGEQLGAAADFKVIDDSLARLGALHDSFRLFTRTDEAYRVTYELMRDGKMPEAETLFGKVLNRMLAPDEEGQLREQQIDGSKMPPYDAVRRYLGPAGAYVKSEANGWVVVGCVLTKEAPAIEEAKDAADQPTSE